MSEPPALQRHGEVVEVKYSSDWLDALRKRLDEAQIADHKATLVTDRMGVQVKPFESSAFHLDPDRFPLRVFYLGRWSSQETRAPGLERAKSTDTADQDSDSFSPAAGKPTQPLSTVLQFEDVWPGALHLKLRAVGGLVEEGALRSLVATDTTGVEIDLSQHDRIPDPALFPLKLHFRALGGAARQNLKENMEGKVSQDSSGGGDHQMESSSSKERSSSKELRAHSTELQWDSMLPDVISNRMRDMGTTVSQSSCMLVTNRIGVQVCMPGGIPERSLFPLKFHIDDSAGEDMNGGVSLGVRAVPTLKEFGQKSRSFFKRSLSKLSGNG